jgi:hypothetical protein|tara:strand:- start:245 stop:625 length:381 start_codon:yes stop_codon:yes gene_type:complete
MDNFLYFSDSGDLDQAQDAHMLPASAVMAILPDDGIGYKIHFEPRANDGVWESGTPAFDLVDLTHAFAVGNFKKFAKATVERINAIGPFTVVADIEHNDDSISIVRLQGEGPGMYGITEVAVTSAD